MTRHYGEELQDLLDGRLTDAQRAEIEAHVAACDRCRRELDALRWVKMQMPGQLAQEQAPANLRERIRTALAAEPRTRRAVMTPRVRRHAWIAAAIAAAALLVVFLRGHKTLPFTAEVAEDFVAYNAGAEPLEFESSDPKAVEGFFARNGVDFPTHVYDLGMMNYGLVGGRVHRLDSRTSALFAYRGSDRTSLVCQMYQGTLSELPATDDVRQHNGFTFHVYRTGNITMVFWQEDDVICVLASDAPAEAVVQLAFAKAMRPPPKS